MSTTDKFQTTANGRRSRFFERDGLWYFATREGIDVGPFDQLDEAKEGADIFLQYINAHPEQTASDATADFIKQNQASAL